jgi:hypothetical protein
MLIRALDETAAIKTIIVSTGAVNLPARKLYENLDFSLIDEILLDEGVKIARYEKRL